MEQVGVEELFRVAELARRADQQATLQAGAATEGGRKRRALSRSTPAHANHSPIRGADSPPFRDPFGAKQQHQQDDGEVHQQPVEEASVELEGVELRTRAVVKAMRNRGAAPPSICDFPDAASYLKDLERCSQFYMPESLKAAEHKCASYAEDRAELARYDRLVNSDRWREVTNREYLERITQMEQRQARACRVESFEPSEVFLHTLDGRRYRASGDVFVCASTGRLHHCTQTTCDSAVALAHNEGYNCSITDRFYPPGFVHSNETTTRRFRDTKDGALPCHGGSSGASVDTWRPTRTPEQRRSFRQKGKLSRSRNEDAMNIRRAENNDSYLYYVHRRDLAPADGAVFEASKAASPQSTITALEFAMRLRSPKVQPPTLNTLLRDQVNEYCRNMYYGAVNFVRGELWRRVKDGEARVKASMPQYYKARRLKNRASDVFNIALKLLAETMPCMERLAVLGPFSPPSVDRAFMRYLEEAVVAVWLLLHYTPWARRFYNGIALNNNVVGILYKLQSGVYVDSVTGKRVYLIPRHSNLDLLPTKGELNRFHAATGSCVGSDDSIETEKLVDECFASLERDEATLDAFSLERYIRLWTSPAGVAPAAVDARDQQRHCRGQSEEGSSESGASSAHV